VDVSIASIIHHYNELTVCLLTLLIILFHQYMS
jgi:hypothetical protein